MSLNNSCRQNESENCISIDYETSDEEQNNGSSKLDHSTRDYKEPHNQLDSG